MIEAEDCNKVEEIVEFVEYIVHTTPRWSTCLLAFGYWQLDHRIACKAEQNQKMTIIFTQNNNLNTLFETEELFLVN